MTISFPDTTVNDNVSFFLDFEGILPRDQTSVYRPDLLVFRDKTDNTDVSVADSGGGNLQVISDELYTGTAGFLSTSSNGLSLGVDPYTIELLFTVPASRTSASQGLLAVNATAAANNWQLALDNLDRVIFSRGTTTEATTVTITDGVLQHIAVVRTGIGTNETKIYLNGVLARTFTDATDYNYTEGLLIGSDRAGGGLTDVFIKAVRISTVAQYTEDFTAPDSLPYVAIGDTYSYLDKIYRWSGVKWFDRSKYIASIPGEFRNYAAISGSANTTSLDLRSANFFELDLVAGVATEVVFENEALSQSFVMRVDGNPVIEGWVPIDEAVYEPGKFKSVAAQETDPFGVFFKPDGTKMYIVGSNTDAVYQYAISTPWDVSTAVFETGKLKSVNTQATNLRGLFFKPDGTKMYIVGLSNSTIFQYALSTPWDVSTANFETGKLKSVAADAGGPHGLFFKPDGTKMYISGGNTRAVHQYALSTPWDVSTANFETGKLKSVAAEDTSPFGVFFKPDGTKMYIMGYNNDTVYQYNTSETFVASVTWPPNTTWSTGAPPSITGTTLIEFYKYNGTWHGNVITENL